MVKLTRELTGDEGRGMWNNGRVGGRGAGEKKGQSEVSRAVSGGNRLGRLWLGLVYLKIEPSLGLFESLFTLIDSAQAH